MSAENGIEIARLSTQVLTIQNTPELIVIAGPMFAGKTTELMEVLTREEYADSKTLMIKPSNDNRYSEEKVVSHSGIERDCVRVDPNDPSQIIVALLEAEKDGRPVDIVGIDEAQFFKTDEMVWVVEEILGHGKKVAAAGLPTDFRDEPFGAMGILMTKADRRIERTAVCMYKGEDLNGKRCRIPATKTQRLVKGQPASYNDPIVLVGAQEAYEARCRVHWKMHDKEPFIVYQSPK